MKSSFFSLKNIWREIRTSHANQYTASRVVSTTIGNILLYFEKFPALVLILYAWNFYSDWKDGKLARADINGPTEFGKAFDPFADKYLFFSTCYFMWRSFQAPIASEFYLPTLLAALACIDLLLLAFGMIGAYLGLDVSANKYGKWKMGFECGIMGLWVLFFLTPPLRLILFQSTLLLTAFQLLFLAAIPFALASLIVHIWDQGGEFIQKIKAKLI